MPETKIILSLEDQQFVKTIRAAFVDVKAFSDAVKVAKKNVSDLGGTAATGSITDLTNRVTSARKAVEGAIPGTQQYENALKRLQVVSNLADRAQSGLANRMRGNVKQGTNEAAYALFNFNRIVSDSAYGILGMANNIEPFVISAQAAIKASGGFKAALAGIFASLAGPTGLVTLVSFAQSILVLWSMNSRGAKKETEDLTNATDELKRSVDEMSRSTLHSMMIMEQAEIGRLEKIRDKIIKKRVVEYTGQGPVERNVLVNQGLSQKEQKSLDAAKERLQIYKDELRGLGLIDNKRREVNEREQAWIHSKDSATKDLNKKLYDQAQKELDVLEDKKNKNQKTIIEIQQDELRLHQLRFQWGNEDLNNYRTYLQEKLRLVKTSNAEELELAISLREELNRVNDIDISGIKARGIEDIKTNFGLMDAIPGIKGGIPTQFPTIDMSRWGGKDTKKLSEGMMMVKSAFQEAGAAMVDAMFGVKTSITEVIAEIGKLIIKTLILKAIEAGFNYLFPGAGSAAGSALGGFSGNSNFADAYTMAAGNKFAGNAQNYLQPVFVFENVIDSQKILYKGVKQRQAIVR